MKLDAARIEKNAQELVARFHLKEFADRALEGLSHGTRQRVAIVSALLHDPEVFVIDEPMVGLDPQHARVVKDVLKERSLAGMTVLVSTHQLEIAEEMSDRIGIITKGEILTIDTLISIKEIFMRPRFSLLVACMYLIFNVIRYNNFIRR